MAHACSKHRSSWRCNFPVCPRAGFLRLEVNIRDSGIWEVSTVTMGTSINLIGLAFTVIHKHPLPPATDISIITSPEGTTFRTSHRDRSLNDQSTPPQSWAVVSLCLALISHWTWLEESGSGRILPEATVVFSRVLNPNCSALSQIHVRK